MTSSPAACIFNETIVTIAKVESFQSATCLSPWVQGMNATDMVPLRVELAFGDVRYASPEPFSVVGKVTARRPVHLVYPLLLTSSMFSFHRQSHPGYTLWCHPTSLVRARALSC